MYKNYIITKQGSIISNYTGKQLYVHTNKRGYQFVRLYVDTKAKTYLVHRLIAGLFIPNTEDKPEVNHKDGNKANNNHWNLEWVTGLENNKHAVEIGLVPRGSNRPNSKLIDADVIALRQLRAQGKNYYELGKLFGITYQTVHKICSRMTYTHI